MLTKILDMLRSFSTSIHKLVLSLLRIVRAYLAIMGDDTKPTKRNNAKLRNAIAGW